MARTRLAVFAAVAVFSAGCANPSVVNTPEGPPTEPAASAPPPSAGPTDLNLVNAFDYFVTADGADAYYFTTPSGKWNCGILPHAAAGCEAAGGRSLGVSGAPATVQTADGNAVAPNAIQVGDEGDPGFTWLDRPGFSVPSGKAMVLDFNKTLAAAGFRCNVQEAGVSCQSETTQNGFTFSPELYLPQYSPVPG